MKRTGFKKEVSYKDFWRSVTNDGRGPCALRGVQIECSSQIDAHHFFPKRRINLKLGGKHKPRAIAAKIDIRNGVALCRDHHDLVEKGVLDSPMPEFYAFFLQSHGLHDERLASQCPEGSDSPARAEQCLEEPNSLSEPPTYGVGWPE